MIERYVLVVLSAGMSLAEWQQYGMLQREMSYFSKLAERLGPIRFLSYGLDSAAETMIAQEFIPDTKVYLVKSRYWAPKRYRSLFASIFPKIDVESLKNCKLIRTTQMSGSWTALKLSRTLKVPLILRAGYLLSPNTLRSAKENKSLKKWALSFWQRVQEKRVAKAASAIIVTYEGARDYFVDVSKVKADKISIIGNPIDTDLFRQQTLPKDEDVLCIARLSPSKNLHNLIAACQIAGVGLTIVGQGPLKNELHEFALKLGSRVKWIQKIPNNEIPALLSRHRVFALVSLYEGNPKALLEAMSTASACLVSDIPEHAFCQHLSNSVKVNVTPSAIAEGLSTLFSDPALRVRIGESARNFCLVNHDMRAAAIAEASVAQTCTGNGTLYLKPAED
jgi:glycosyltransferase involved in cell wall biosynthesis